MTVIGITPEAFVGTSGLVPVELFVPATEGAHVEPGWTELLTNRLPEAFFLTGRLRSGVTVAEAAAELDVLAAALATEHPEASRHSELHVVSERDARPSPCASRHTAPLMAVVVGLASFVLRIAVANVGTLLVGRGIARRQEMALRAGLGATRRRLVRQLITESVLLALVGGAGGGIVALWTADFVMTGAATELNRSIPARDLSADWRIFGFTATVATVAGLVAGLAPALRSTRIELARAIGSGGRGSGGGVPGRRLTNGLVVVQVAVSMLLLVCAGLFVQSSRNARRDRLRLQDRRPPGAVRRSARPGVRPGAGPCFVPGDRPRRRRLARRQVGELGAQSAGAAGRELGRGVHPGRRHRAGARRGAAVNTVDPGRCSPTATLRGIQRLRDRPTVTAGPFGASGRRHIGTLALLPFLPVVWSFPSRPGRRAV